MELKDNVLILDKEINNLDKFVIDFIEVLKKYTDYVIISGYVSILLGRTRTTEDVDLFIKKIDFDRFSKFYEDLISNGFWCLNAEDPKEIFEYLNNKVAVRFAKQGKTIPNFEVKFPKNHLDDAAFLDTIKVKISDHELIISSLERQIAFKRYYLGSDKDEEDALYVEELFKEQLNYGKILKLKDILTRK